MRKEWTANRKQPRGRNSKPFVDIRGQVSGAHVKIFVFEDGLQMSMNGAARFSDEDFGAMVMAIEAAKNSLNPTIEFAQEDLDIKGGSVTEGGKTVQRALIWHKPTGEFGEGFDRSQLRAREKALENLRAAVSAHLKSRGEL